MDKINPDYYKQGGVECIDAIKSIVPSGNGFIDFLRGQVIKYIWRFPQKNGIEDVKKAEWYLNRLHAEVLDAKQKPVSDVTVGDILDICSTRYMSLQLVSNGKTVFNGMAHDITNEMGHAIVKTVNWNEDGTIPILTVEME